MILFSRVQKSYFEVWIILGLYHYFRKEYTEAVENFQKSLALNSFQLETLLRLGYSAIQLEAWEIAATTYWKYCTYESEVTLLGSNCSLNSFIWISFYTCDNLRCLEDQSSCSVFGNALLFCFISFIYHVSTHIILFSTEFWSVEQFIEFLHQAGSKSPGLEGSSRGRQVWLRQLENLG